MARPRPSQVQTLRSLRAEASQRPARAASLDGLREPTAYSASSARVGLLPLTRPRLLAGRRRLWPGLSLAPLGRPPIQRGGRPRGPSLGLANRPRRRALSRSRAPAGSLCSLWGMAIDDLVGRAAPITGGEL